MFEAIAALVDRRAWVIVVGWLGLIAALYAVAPEWEQVSRDDEVRFFPPGYASVVGQDLYERGFPDDASSSQVVIVAERRAGRLTPADLAYVDDLARRLNDLRSLANEFGLSLRPLTPELASRFGRSKEAEGLVVISVNGDSPAATAGLRAGDLITRMVVDREARPVQGVGELEVQASRSDGLDLFVRSGNAPERPVALSKALGIKQVVSHRTPVVGPRLIGNGADGGQAALTVVALKSTYQSKRSRLVVDRLQEEMGKLKAPPDGLSLATTGSASVGHDMNVAAIASVNNTTNATIALVVIILLVVYRSPLLALVPLVTIALSVWASLLAIAMMAKVPGLQFQVINITNIFVIVVLFGAGTDYCLFLIARYREELARGRDSTEALDEAIRQVGGALVASAGTVICGLGMLWFSTFAKIRYTGPAIALSLAIGLVASLTLAPVLLHWLRGTVFWPFRPPHHIKGRDPEAESLEQNPMVGFWIGVADRVVRRPGLILAISLLALTPLAIVGAQTRPSYSQLADLGNDQPSIAGARMIQRYFPVGEISPSWILVRDPSVDFLSREGRSAVDAISRRLAALPNVAEVRSLTQPLGKPLIKPAAEPARPGIFQGIQKGNFRSLLDQSKSALVGTVTNAYYVCSSTKASPEDRNHITRIELVFQSDPFSPESMATLDAARRAVAESMGPGKPLAASGVTLGLSGSTALVDDLRKVTTQDERRMYVLVTIGVYLILVVLLRRPVICLYLIFTVVLGYLASLGVTELVFRSLHKGPEPWAGLDWKVGFFLFVILVAVGEDYNIFLMARVLEEERKHGPVEGTRLAVAHTGGIISSCGLIMAGTFGSMLAASLTALRELGFALGLGVLLDTFIVRPILVPAFVVLIHRGRAVPAVPSSSALDQPEAAATTAP